jgi:Zn-dependent metalloprotease
MAKQWVEKKMAKDADWLVGEDCFLPEQKGTGVRNMKNPGTAYKAQFLVCSTSYLRRFPSTKFCSSLEAMTHSQQMSQA